VSHDALTHFIAQTRAAFELPTSAERSTTVRAALERLTTAPVTEPWLEDLYRENPASKELYRDERHGFILLAHVEATGLCRPPHDHGQSWVVYALARGEMEVGTFARTQDADGRVRLVKRDTTQLRAGEARVYLPGDIHDTRCVEGPSLLFRFTERDLREEERAQRLTRYVARDGSWTVGPA